MLEDFSMEKKSSVRTVQTPVKSTGAESKKLTEVTGVKAFPRSGGRRDPVNGNGLRNDASRKSAPQKGKYYDKRPRAKGESNICGTEDSQVEQETTAEYGSVLIPGSKKQNWNHLLNFHYAPRESTSHPPRSWLSQSGNWSRRLMATHKHKYNKEQFLQANCQFIVKLGGNYTECMGDPDILVDWDLIEQIFWRSSEEISCPICLYPPVAAKMTRCGHMYCWSCILHYLALSDKTWRKCPICYEAVHKQDLKSVISLKHAHFAVGDTITLHLMKREKECFIALPVNQYGAYSQRNLMTLSETKLDTTYSKLLLATPQEVLKIIGREKRELEVQLSENQGCPEMCFIEQAIQLVQEREQLISAPAMVQHKSEKIFHYEHTKLIDTKTRNLSQKLEGDSKVNVQQPSQTHVDYSSEDITVPKSLPLSVHEGNLEHSDGKEAAVCSNLDERDMQSVPMMIATDTSSAKCYFFYQSADGQHIYLHSLNVRMLEHHYGSLQNCPPTLTGRIVEKESGSVTEELRRRLRYLGHLPLTCQFEVVEIQLKPPLVNVETMDLFQDKLEARKRQRQKRARDERRREKWINEEEKRRWGQHSSPSLHLHSDRHFPQWCMEVEHSGSNYSVSPIESSVASSPVPYGSDVSALCETMENINLGMSSGEEAANVNKDSPDSTLGGMSFAQMLREGRSKPLFTWKTGKIENQSMGAIPRIQQEPDEEPEPDGYVPVPVYSQSFSDAIEMAMEKAACMQDHVLASETSGKKKKKQKQKVLFSTGMAYGIK